MEIDSDTSYIPSDSDTSSTDGSSFIDTEIDLDEIEDLYEEIENNLIPPYISLNAQ